MQYPELEKDLRKVLIDSEAEVYVGHKVLEIKPSNMHKGAQITEMLTEERWDFIIAIGDDYTDEDMFRVLPERAYTINVGKIHSTNARFQLKSVSEVVDLLESLTK